MSAVRALGSGLVGAGILTLIHETVRRQVPTAPRMDVLGMRAIERPLRALGVEPPAGDRLHQAALGGDLLSNSLYYSLVAAGDPETAPFRGAVLGLAAGVGAVTLPGPMGLGSEPSKRTFETAAMAVGWYLLGGLAAGLAYRFLGDAPGERRYDPNAGWESTRSATSLQNRE